VPYAEIALNAKDRLVGGTANANTIRGAWNEWTAQFPKGTRHPVQTGVHAVLLLRSAQGNDNLVGLDCEFRPDQRDAAVVITPTPAAAVTPVERQFLNAALAFFRSRSPAVQQKVLRLFSELWGTLVCGCCVSPVRSVGHRHGLIAFYPRASSWRPPIS